MQLSYWQQCNDQQQAKLLTRPAVAASDSISQAVSDILAQVKQNGDEALKAFSNKFDKVQIKQIKLTQQEIKLATSRVDAKLKQAMQLAVANIEKFHQAQVKQTITVETMPGIQCQLVTRPIDSVGLYIPGGSAPLFSTVLMLATPAKIAGCRKIILCSPPPIAVEILYDA